MGDLNNENLASTVKITGDDELVTAAVETIGGKPRLLTDTNVSSVTVPNGQDPIPDTYFEILTAGAISDTIRIQIDGTSVDSTSPDSDLPAVDFTYTLVAEDVGDERKLAENFSAALNLDSNFSNAFLDARAIVGDKRPIVHITCTEFSLSGEFHERPSATAVTLTPSGTTDLNIDSENRKIISRPKQTSLDRDPNNPHRLGIIGISGQVRIRADKVDKLFFSDAENTGSNDLTINGGTTPTIFTIAANPAGGDNIFIEQLKLFGTDTNIKVASSSFLGASAISNGIKIDIFQNGSQTTLPLIKNTMDFLARFGTTASDNKIINQSGGDFIEAVFDLISKNVIIELKAGTADRIEIYIQDDLTSITDLIFSAEGFEEAP
jgi:hypothetical protein